MAYDMYFGNVLMPVTPSEIHTTITNQNTTINLINESEVNLLKSAGLTEISFTLLIPQVKYPFARQQRYMTNKTTGEVVSQFTPASVYLDLLESLKMSKNPFQFIVSRYLPTGKLLFDTNIKVVLEDYKINESAKQGFDLEIDVNLKQYKSHSTKTVLLDTPTPTAPVIVREDRDETIPVKTFSSTSSGGGGGGGSKKKTTASSIVKKVGDAIAKAIKVGATVVGAVAAIKSVTTKATTKVDKVATKTTTTKKSFFLK